MTTLTILYLIFAKDDALRKNKLITPSIMKRVTHIRALKYKITRYIFKGLSKHF